MSEFDLTPDQERKLFEEYAEEQLRRQQFKTTATPQYAQTVGSMYRNHPYAPAGLILSTARAVSNGMMNEDQANNFVLAASRNQLSTVVQEKQQKKEKKSWFDRNIVSKVRAGGRWTFAALNFVPQVITNIASQPFKGDAGTEGFFISTDLGTLIKNDEVAGDGWFMGGKALELQAERARRYRGEIDGHAWTIGRGLASVVAQPGSREYNILSGLVDATAAIAAPSVPGFQAAKGAAGVAASKAGMRALAGLTNFESAVIQLDKVETFLDTAGGRSLIKRITKIKDIDDALDAFKGVQHMDFINNIVARAGEGEGAIRSYLLETLGRPIKDARGIVGVGVETIDQINLSRLSDVKRLVGRSSFAAKMMASVPGQHLVLQGGNARDVAQTVRNVNNYMKLLKVDRAERASLVQRFSNALVENNGDVFGAVNQFDEILERSLLQMGVPKEAIEQITGHMKGFVKNKDVYGALGRNGEPTAYNARMPLPNGQVAFIPSSTPGFESELLKHLSMTLPDARQVRRMMSNVGWMFGKGQLKVGTDMKKIGELENEINAITKSLDTVTDKTVLAAKTDEINNLRDQITQLQGTRLRNPERYGQLRLPLSMLDGFQSEIWRPMTLMTGGYVLRNMTDSAFRYTMTPGLRKGSVFHPLEWIQIANYRKFRGTLPGVKWNELTSEGAERLAKEMSDEFHQATGQTLREATDPRARWMQGARDKLWNKADIYNLPNYRKGVMDELTLALDDRVARQVAAGESTEDIVARLMSSGTDGPEYVRRMQSAWANQVVELVDNSSPTVIGTGERIVGTPNFIDEATGEFAPEAEAGLTWFVDEFIRPRLRDIHGGDQRLIDAIATGKVVDATGREIDIIKTGAGGMPIGYSDEFRNMVKRVVDEDMARRAAGETPLLKNEYKFGTEINQFNPSVPGRELPNWIKSWNRTTDYFFGALYPKRSQYLMQSPVFRQYYYETAGKFVDELNTQALNQIQDGLQKVVDAEKAEFTKDWLRSYVGDTKTADRLYEKLLKGEGTGDLSLSELDAYAKGAALDRTKELFYNATEKSNFADIMRIIVPFGSAWAEVITAWTKIASQNPMAVRRVGITVQGLRNADPDGDGKGFFWKDPSTGEYVFNYPFSDQIGGLAAALIPTGAALGGVAFGVPGIIGGAIGGGLAGAGIQEATGLENVRMTAPLKSLNMGLNIYPGMGPMVQIGANKILSKYPSADFIRDVILPYGEPDISTIGPIPVPSWGRKLIEAMKDPDNSRLLGDMVVDTMRVLQASGDYNLDDPEEVQRLEDDATSRARVLLVLRGLGQFVGPTRPDIDFKVGTYQGDKYASELSKAFYDMRAENYDTAVQRFMETFGEDAFLYVQGKTKAASGGLDASSEFGRFERENQYLFNQYPDVAGFFAPVGGNFDYQVYLRQIEQGGRERIKPSDFVDAAQAVVGKSLYRQVTRQIGSDPSDEQRAALRQVRDLLYRRYPGFAKAIIDVNARKARIFDLQRAMIDPALDSNPVAQGARIYFQYRDQMQGILRSRGSETGDLSAKSAGDLRGYLRDVADVIIDRYPEFARLYDYVLFDEVEEANV